MFAETVYAVHPFIAMNDDEIGFQSGEPIIVLEKDEMYADGWWLGQNVYGQIGLFPMNYTSYSKPTPHLPTNDSIQNNFEKTINSEPQTQGPLVDYMQSNLRESVAKNMSPSKHITGSISSIKEETSLTSLSEEHSNKSSVTSEYLSSFSQDESSDPTTWNLERVRQWLEEEGFDSVIDRFIENDITGDVLVDMNQDSLKEINIPSYGKRVRIMNAIKVLKNEHSLNNEKNHNDKSIDKVRQPNENSETKSTVSDSTIHNLQPSTDSKIPSDIHKPDTFLTIPYATQDTPQDTVKNTSLSGDPNGEKIQTITGKTLRNKGSKIFSKLNFTSKGDEDREDKGRMASHKRDDKVDEKYKGEKGSPHFSFRSKKKKESTSNGGWDFLVDGEEAEIKSLDREIIEREVKLKNVPEKGQSLRSVKSIKWPQMDQSNMIENKSDPPMYSASEIMHESNHLENALTESDEDKVILKNIGTPDYEGWLKKQGDKYKSWKNRYCILKGVNLYYLQSDKLVQTPRVKGYLNLTGYRVVSDESILQGKYGFKLIHDTERTYYFAHENSEKARGWMKAIMKATISRDIKTPVVSSSNLTTVSLSEARNIKRGVLNSSSLSNSRPSASISTLSVNKVTSPKPGRSTSTTSPSLLQISPPILGRYISYNASSSS